MAPASNEIEKERWNDAYWTKLWPQREALTDTVTADLLAHLAAQRGERVLDIGSGGGRTALAVGAQVGPTGRVVGVDISHALVTLAQSRAAEAELPNVEFVVADAQEEAIPGGPFAAATSQFGVMFFDEPVMAFRNLRRHVAPGGRLAFACWQAMDRNPWALGHALGLYAPPHPSPGPGKGPTGPFVLGDVPRTVTLLDEAGWADVRVAPYERTVTIDRSAIFDDGQLAFNGVPAEDLPAARDAVARHLAQFARPDGQLDVSMAFLIVGATKRSGADPDPQRAARKNYTVT
jgi:SAM-dependent methyltransferase